MTTLFISDLHLMDNRPDITAGFEYFCETIANNAKALYILGDLFEFWIGDDDEQSLHDHIANLLSQLHEKGTDVFFMPGNRDFLLGEKYCRKAAMQLIPDPLLLQEENQQPLLLMHGDSLCTADTEYMKFRVFARDPNWQQQFLAMPMDQRLQIALQARMTSKEATHQKAADIMDVTEQAVIDALTEYKSQRLLHGHTHRPATHELNTGKQRMVLGDWDKTGWYAQWQKDELQLIEFDFPSK